MRLRKKKRVIAITELDTVAKPRIVYKAGKKYYSVLGKNHAVKNGVFFRHNGIIYKMGESKYCNTKSNINIACSNGKLESISLNRTFDYPVIIRQDNTEIGRVPVNQTAVELNKAIDMTKPLKIEIGEYWEYARVLPKDEIHFSVKEERKTVNFFEEGRLGTMETYWGDHRNYGWVVCSGGAYIEMQEHDRIFNGKKHDPEHGEFYPLVFKTTWGVYDSTKRTENYEYNSMLPFRTEPYVDEDVVASPYMNSGQAARDWHYNFDYPIDGGYFIDYVRDATIGGHILWFRGHHSGFPRSELLDFKDQYTWFGPYTLDFTHYTLTEEK